MGEVSRGRIEAAQAAEAIHCAGPLRMLLQRHVKALALRAVVRRKVDDSRAATACRVQANLHWLHKLPLTALVAAQRAVTQSPWCTPQDSAGTGAGRRAG